MPDGLPGHKPCDSSDIDLVALRISSLEESEARRKLRANLMISAIIYGLPLLLVGAVIFSIIRYVRGGRLFDPGPRSLKEMIEQKRTIIHPDDVPD